MYIVCVISSIFVCNEKREASYFWIEPALCFYLVWAAKNRDLFSLNSFFYFLSLKLYYLYLQCADKSSMASRSSNSLYCVFVDRLPPIY